MRRGDPSPLDIEYLSHLEMRWVVDSIELVDMVRYGISIPSVLWSTGGIVECQ